jgi:phosphoserine phosphatase RsbU/P
LIAPRKRRFPAFDVKRFLARQQRYIAIAVAIWAALWAVDRHPDVSTTLAYTLPLCNLIAFVKDYRGFLYERKSPVRSWAGYLLLLVVVGIVGVGIVNVIQYPMSRAPGQTLWAFLRSGWKIPFMATMIVGISMELYRRARERLESKNRELEQRIEREAAERELQGQELQQAREIQQSLLPKEIPQIPGFEIDGAWEPARVVGGDYFDVIRLSRTRLGICIADVVGKSVSAALLMASVQASVRAFAPASTSPSDLCRRVNSVLCSSIGTGKFVTLFYGVLDAEQRTFRYANAGHLLPILMRAGGEVEELENGGAVLGVFPAWTYEDSLLQLESGDRLLLFTDGITEAGFSGGAEFGEEGVIASVRKCRSHSAHEFTASVLADAKQFCSSQLRDDATLVGIATLPCDGPVTIDARDAGALTAADRR